MQQAFPPTKDQAYIQAPAGPDEQGIIHTELSALLRWEDDGGRTSWGKSILFMWNGISREEE